MNESLDNDMSGLTVGVLALQGDYERHLDSLNLVGATACEVRSVRDFEALDALILPGGESTTMALLLREFEMWSALQSFVRTKPVWGTCAGLILLCSAIEDESGATDKTFKPLGVLNVTVARNAYGRQIHSFESSVEIIDGSEKFVAPVSFIRAPKITRVGAGVEALATTDNSPTLVRQNNILGSAFHTELHEETKFVRYFLELISAGRLSGRQQQNVGRLESPPREVA